MIQSICLMTAVYSYVGLFCWGGSGGEEKEGAKTFYEHCCWFTDQWQNWKIIVFKKLIATAGLISLLGVMYSLLSTGKGREFILRGERRPSILSWCNRALYRLWQMRKILKALCVNMVAGNTKPLYDTGKGLTNPELIPNTISGLHY